MLINIDIDGVLFPFDQKFTEFVKKKYNKKVLPPMKKWDFWKDWDMDKATFDADLPEFVADEVALNSPVLDPDCYDVLERLDKRHKINLVTNRSIGYPFGCSNEMKINTIAWLDRVGLKATNLCFLENKSFLAGVLLDDNIFNLVSASIPVCYSHAWNSAWDGTRVSNFLQFETVIKQLEVILSREKKVGH